jgi:hypothetical protein
MNKIAEILFGKVANIYETTRTLDEMKKLFSPAALLVDITNIDDVAIGYRVDFKSATDFTLIPPAKILPETLDEAKIAKIKELKSIRDAKEVAVITYNGKTYDYDDKARERMRIAKDALVDNNIASQTWTCADNTKAELTVADFKAINTLAAQRSGQLHDKYNELKNQVEAMTSIDEIRAVKF